MRCWGCKMHWTSELPNRAGYYWYLGPVLTKDYRRAMGGKNIRLCTPGPIIALVGFDPSRSLGKHDWEAFWRMDGGVVCFVGYSKKLTLEELSMLPQPPLWAGPIVPPYSKSDYEAVQGSLGRYPATCELEASERSAWGEWIKGK